jgi:amidophosphoribosyltransferase
MSGDSRPILDISGPLPPPPVSHMDELRHECGIAALYHLANGDKAKVWTGDPDEVTRLMPRMLMDLQNRGQLAAGMASYKPGREQLLDTHKDVGTVAEAFSMSRPHKFASILEEYAGRAVIGHTRYATSGPTGKSYAQPFEQVHGCRWKWFAFAFNGNLANFEELKAELLADSDYHLTRDNDTEVILHLLSREMQRADKPDLFDVFKTVAARLDGAFNLVFLNALGEMVVLRDPLGLRPLCYAIDGPIFAAASESVPLLNLGFDEDEIVSLEPGEMVIIADGKVTKRRYAERRTPKHCFFEWVYFANVASTLDDKSVYLSRSKLGEELAEQELDSGVPIDQNTIVVPVPDTSKAAADAMAYKLGVRSLEGLIRNRYVGRTFIEAGNRADKVRLKFTPLRQVLKGKRIFLVEDSIVRGTTLKTLLGYLRDVGEVSEIHVRVACPPIVAPCFYGIDMAKVKDLYAPQFMNGLMEPTPEQLEAMAKDLGADSLRYLPLDALARCIDVPPHKLCRACVTGDYPTERGQRKYELEMVGTPSSDGNACGGVET